MIICNRSLRKQYAPWVIRPNPRALNQHSSTWSCAPDSYIVQLIKPLKWLKAEHIMWNVSLDESQSDIKIAKINIKNFRYGGDTTLMAESEEELKSLLKG